MAWKWTALVLVVLAAGCRRGGTEPQPSGGEQKTTAAKGPVDDGPQPLEFWEKQDTGGVDPKLIVAWEHAGTRFGWFGHSPEGSVRFSRLRWKTQRYLELPGFLALDKLPNNLQELPAPAVPFGVGFIGVPTVDGSLKALARFDNLQLLSLDTAVMTAGAWEGLAALKQLKTLYRHKANLGDGTVPALSQAGLLHALSYVWAPNNQRPAGPDDAVYGDFDAALIGDGDVKALAALPQLRGLVLSRTSVSDAGLKALAALPRLQALDLGWTPIGDEGLKVLAGFRQLTWLELRGTAITDAGLKNLASLESLETLDLGETQTSDAGLAALADLRQLRKLRLDRTKVGDPSTKLLAKHTRLETLDLSHTSVSDAGLKELTPLTQLRELTLIFTQYSGVGLKEFAAFKQLQQLTFERAKINDATLQTFRALKLLHTLVVTVGKNQRPCAGPEDVEEVYFHDTKITDAGVKELAAFPKVRVVSFEQTEVGDAGMKELAALQELNSLSIGKTKVGRAGLKELTACKQLRNLHILKLPLGDGDLEALAALQQLTYLALYDTNVTAEGMASLRKAMPNCRIHPP
jgi:hypothetical protein